MLGLLHALNRAVCAHQVARHRAARARADRLLYRPKDRLSVSAKHTSRAAERTKRMLKKTKGKAPVKGRALKRA